MSSMIIWCLGLAASAGGLVVTALIIIIMALGYRFASSEDI
mgnify:CR=1 FL=1